MIYYGQNENRTNRKFNFTEGINRGQPRNNVPNSFNNPPHNYPISMSTNGLPPPGGMTHNQPFHPQSQKMPMQQQPWSGGSAGSSGKIAILEVGPVSNESPDNFTFYRGIHEFLNPSIQICKNNGVFKNFIL